MVKTESIAHMMVFHITSAVALMDISINNDVETALVRSMLEEMAKNSGSVLEHALWETYKDFLDPKLNTAIADNVVPFIQ